jgi:hypothetical protein
MDIYNDTSGINIDIELPKSMPLAEWKEMKIEK